MPEQDAPPPRKTEGVPRLRRAGPARIGLRLVRHLRLGVLRVSGKGDDIRPRQISDEDWEANYRRTFPGRPKRKAPGAAERDARRLGQLELPIDEK